MPALVMPTPLSVPTAEKPWRGGGVFNPLADGRGYDAKVADHPNASAFHRSSWIGLLHRTYGFEPLCLASRAGSLLPLMEVSSPITGRRGVALPFTDFAPPLLKSAEDFPELWAAALDCARERKWKSFELRNGGEFLPNASASTSFYGHELDLRAGEDALFSGVDSSVRRAIRKAEASNLVVEQAHSEAGMQDYYRLHCLTRKKHGLPPQSWGFFLNIWRDLVSNQSAFVFLAKRGGRPLAGAVFLRNGRRAIYKFGASDDSALPFRANNLVMWEAIKFLAKSEVDYLHFGRTSLSNVGLRRFKLGWGAKEHELEYLKYDLRREGFVTEPDRAHGLHNRLFRAMPMFLFKASGAMLYRHIA